MQINEIKQDAFYAKRVKRINKWIEIRGVQILLLAVVEGTTDTQLWYMSRSLRRAELRQELIREGLLVDDYTEMTIRQYLLMTMREDSCGDHFSIESLCFNGIPVNLISSGGSGFYEGNIKNWMAFQYFYEQGMDFSPWNDVESEEIMLNAATLELDSTVDVFAASGDHEAIAFSVVASEAAIRMPLKEPLRFTAARNESKTIHYKDPLTGKHRSVHIKGVEVHDMWAEMEKNISEGWGLQLSEEERKQTMEQMEESMAQSCPRGKVYALLVYDEEENRQLEFYETPYLDSQCAIGNAVSIAAFFGQDDTKGPNGHPYRLAPIRTMDPGEVEVFEVELLGVYVWVDGERIEV